MDEGKGYRDTGPDWLRVVIKENQTEKNLALGKAYASMYEGLRTGGVTHEVAMKLIETHMRVTVEILLLRTSDK